jgi:D-arabinose 1-dehydrogenase-like Zn-dependent alcohol dehydrogenase
MAKLMKAAVVRQFRRPLNIEEVSIPAPGPGEVLLKVMATGVCHTDLYAADGDWLVKPVPPFIPGHEGAASVAAAGAGAEYAIGSAAYVARLPAKGNGQPGRAAAGRFCHPDLRCGSQAHHVARIDRWHAQGPGRSHRFCQQGR